MMIAAIALAALLFVLAGLLPQRGCTGNCADCAGSCGRHTEDHHEA